MKKRILTIAIMTVLLGMGAHAAVSVTVSTNGSWLGFMSVYNIPQDPVNPNVRQFGNGWGTADLVATFSGDTLSLSPNTIGDPNAYWYLPSGGPGSVGNKIMDANMYVENTGQLNGQTVIFSATVLSDTLSLTNNPFNYDANTNGWTAVAFIKDFAPDYSSFVVTNIVISSGTFSISLDTINDPSRHVQYGFTVNGPCVWSTDVGPYGSIQIEGVADNNAPMPDPMTFAQPPTNFVDGVLSDSKITMTATSAVDASGGAYYFTCVSGGGNDSGWRGAATYTDTGLAAGTEYVYTVKARDLSSNSNETAQSAPATNTTAAVDLTPPSPATISFDQVPVALNSATIYMSAVPATDPSGVEYYFDCTSGGGSDSDWQDESDFVATGLSPDTEYAYTVIARDKSGAMNSNTVSAASSATTKSVASKWGSYPLTGYTDDSTQLSTLSDLGDDGLEVTYIAPKTTGAVTNKAVTFGPSGADFGANAVDDAGRNIIRTVASDYSVSSFEAYVTIERTAANQNAFIGFGQGLDGAYGVPDLSLAGVSAVFSEFTPTLTKIWSQYQGNAGNENLQNVTTSNGIHRLRLEYDADAQTATVSVDLDYVAPAAFSSDLTFGTVATTNLSTGAPVRIYMGGDDNLVFKDLLIQAPEPVDGLDNAEILDIETDPGGSGTEITWFGEGGRTYDLEYRSSLTSGSWEKDISDILIQTSVTNTVTSTRNLDSVFYRILTK